LSIIDLTDERAAAGVERDSQYWITFNAEIYNYVELREELIARGHCFRSHRTPRSSCTSSRGHGPRASIG
jgi:asparagine synthase (glutamine-hydrolysing)